jgi:hypothetical protein
MDLLILKETTRDYTSVYRGTDRPTIYYQSTSDENHEVNRAFLWYCREGGQLGVVHDLAKAREVVEACRRLDPPQYFEVIEVTTENRPPTIGGSFLGFDLSSGYHYSLLSWGLEIDRPSLENTPEDDPLWIIQPLLHLIKKHFQPQLNSNGLFDEYDTARLCLDCMMALQSIRPGLWENEEVKFEVVGLWRVFPG